eukprot:COSAG03_NODE_2929_length_2349_cov_1.765778_1_plen_670_part_10
MRRVVGAEGLRMEWDDSSSSSSSSSRGAAARDMSALGETRYSAITSGMERTEGSRRGAENGPTGRPVEPKASARWDVERAVVSGEVRGRFVKVRQHATTVAELERRLAKRQEVDVWLTVLLPRILGFVSATDRKAAARVCRSWHRAVRAGCSTCVRLHWNRCQRVCEWARRSLDPAASCGWMARVGESDGGSIVPSAHLKLISPLCRMVEACENLTRLDASGGDLGPAGAALLASSLRHNRSMKELDMGTVAADGSSRTLGTADSGIGSEGGVAIAAALHGGPPLVTLGLSDNNLGDDVAVALGRDLVHNKTLQSLDLAGNHIGPTGALALADALCSNQCLRLLNLEANRLGNQGGLALAVAIEHNASLTKLDLYDNQLGMAGIVPLLQALRRNHVLRAVNLCENGVLDKADSTIVHELVAQTNSHVLLDLASSQEITEADKTQPDGQTIASELPPTNMEYESQLHQMIQQIDEAEEQRLAATTIAVHAGEELEYTHAAATSLGHQVRQLESQLEAARLQAFAAEQQADLAWDATRRDEIQRAQAAQHTMVIEETVTGQFGEMQNEQRLRARRPVTMVESVTCLTRHRTPLDAVTESPNLPEARNAFKALLVGASRRYSAAIGKLGNQTAAKTYDALAAKVEKDIKKAGSGGDSSVDPWYKNWGMHASGD